MANLLVEEVGATAGKQGVADAAAETSAAATGGLVVFKERWSLAEAVEGTENKGRRRR